MDKSTIKTVSFVFIVHDSTRRYVQVYSSTGQQDKGMTNYNEQFVEAWKQTTNSQGWRRKEHAGIDDVHAG